MCWIISVIFFDFRFAPWIIRNPALKNDQEFGESWSKIWSIYLGNSIKKEIFWLRCPHLNLTSSVDRGEKMTPRNELTLIFLYCVLNYQRHIFLIFVLLRESSGIQRWKMIKNSGNPEVICEASMPDVTLWNEAITTNKRDFKRAFKLG